MQTMNNCGRVTEKCRRHKKLKFSINISTIMISFLLSAETLKSTFNKILLVLFSKEKWMADKIPKLI